jgi:hypothetical protein
VTRGEWIALAAVVAAGAATMHMRGRPDAGFRLPHGSLASAPPPGEALPPDPAFVAAELRPPFPTNRWWSSLVALRFSERQYPHPLAVAARPEGLQVRYPGPDIRANEACICGWMDFEPVGCENIVTLPGRTRESRHQDDRGTRHESRYAPACPARVLAPAV